MILSKLEKLTQIMPAHVRPRFKTLDEYLAWHKAEGERYSKKMVRQHRQARIEALLGRSGIQKLHQYCGFKNYHVDTPEQAQAKQAASDYLKQFGSDYGGFVFSGGVGTGKNHLATAIVRNLILSGHSAAIITVAELVMTFRACYERDAIQRESAVMQMFLMLDLLVLDEVGVQKKSHNEFEINLLSQIIDRRQLQLKPTGMLTNLTYEQLSTLLGERIMDRQTSRGIWVPFTWSSYRQHPQLPHEAKSENLEHPPQK